MELNNLFGVPAHPLVVHAAVVVLPLAAISLVLVALIPKARRHYAPVVLGAAILATVAVGLAQGSGESLEERVDRTELLRDHTSQGETVLPWAIAVSVVAAAVTALGYQPVRRRVEQLPAKAVSAVVVVAALVSSIGAIVTIVDVGHSGAKAAWDDVGTEASGK